MTAQNFAIYQDNFLGTIAIAEGVVTTAGVVIKVNDKSIQVKSNDFLKETTTIRHDSANWPTVRFTDMTDEQVAAAELETQPSLAQTLQRQIAQANLSPEDALTLIQDISEQAIDKIGSDASVTNNMGCMSDSAKLYAIHNLTL